MSGPVFVVVGHVNRGKSSIVSTLAADDSVRIDSMPGTTKLCREYPMRVGGETLYMLVDTPGFERPRQTLAWLREQAGSTAERRQVVEQFVAKHQASGEYPQECELLAPILAGAAILYVVDGSKPPSPNYEAEMEILRWTAQPRVALINATSEADYTSQWRSILDQYFNMVRPFNAHRAGFAERIRLLRMLREMSDDSRAPIDRAIRALIDDRRRMLADAAGAVAEMLAEMLTLVLDKRLGSDADPVAHREALAQKYFDRLRKLEQQCRNRLKGIFWHERLEVSEDSLDSVSDDLFNLDMWNRLGLTRSELTTAGAAAGALAGGIIDASVGGASFLAGTLIGGAVGGAASWYGAWRLPKVSIKGIPLGGQRLLIGPMKNPNFPWVALNRALLFVDAIADRAHAARQAIEVRDDGREGVVADLSDERRKAIESCFTRLRKKPGAQAQDAITSELADKLQAVIEDRHGGDVDAA